MGNNNSDVQRTPLLIIGGHNLAAEIRETAEQVYDGEILNVIADDDKCDYPFIYDSEIEKFVINHHEVKFILGFTIKKLRDKYKELFRQLGVEPQTIVSPKAYVSPTAKIGKGSFVGPNVVLSTNVSIGDYCVINFLVGIGHDASLGDDVIVNPGAKISGHCVIGASCLIGTNSFVHQGIGICENTIVDALTHVRKGCKDPTLYSDKNAKQIRVPNLLTE